MTDKEAESQANGEVGAFAGPLFLVGMPRSGTKLLRDMLNQGERIRFSPIETEFLPFWVRHWDQFADLETRSGFDRFYRRCTQLPFFVENAERGIEVGCEEWFLACKDFTPSAVFEALMRTILGVATDSDEIWGDKSPSYISHLPLLAREFPEAKFVHIVRDVRDCSLSAHRAWGKSLLRAAQRWQDDVSKCRADGSNLAAGRYVELRYEDLLADPRGTLGSICAFIGVALEEQMLAPVSGTEDKGDAKGMSALLTSNVRKYESRLAPDVVRRIESIACETLRDLNYPCLYGGQPVRLTRPKLRLLQLLDGLNLVRAAARERGVLGAMRFHREYFRVSGNRLR
jgi:Sulfotransferase family